MPIEFESLVHLESPQKGTFLHTFLSNPIYTSISISVIFIVVVLLFFPLSKNKFKSYFKLLVYMGLINTFVISLHDGVVEKMVEEKYKPQEDQQPVAEKIEVAPMIGGQLPEIKQEDTSEIDQIIEKLENETKDENAADLN